MRQRELSSEGGGDFLSTALLSSTARCIPTGCALLDCVLGGGYGEGRIVNIVGDKSTGKTLLAIEAAANFMRRYPKGRIFYTEVEAAFDREYAAALGLPVEHVEFTTECFTVEDLFNHLTSVVKELSDKTPALYILDSLDALSDRGELERGIDEGTYGVAKAKKMSQLFRRLVQSIEQKRMTVLIVSQVRDNIGVAFGKKYVRSGGRALDFYASQVLYLSQVGRIERSRGNVKRVVGIKVRAKCEKNKVGLPFRQCEFPLVFGFGMDDVSAGLDWLESVGALSGLEIDGKTAMQALKRELKTMDDDKYWALRDRISRVVRAEWKTIETGFIPTRTKY